MKPVFRLLARLPLGANHAVGAVLGRLVFALSPSFRARTLENLRLAAIAATDRGLKDLARANAAQMGRGLTELAWALFRPAEEVSATVTGRQGWEAVERLRAQGRPIIFVTPHLGGYDIGGRYLACHLPVLAMYRPNKIAWIDAMIREGRNRGAAPDGTNVAPATMAGVRMLLRHLKRGGCTIMLPDQVPGQGEGEWVEFFGRPAYTMTLIGRLQESSGAAIVFFFAERLPCAGGFCLRFEELEAPLDPDRRIAARTINERVERLVRSCPAQYLWGYNRYKRPAGAPLPPVPGPPADAKVARPE